PPPPPTPIHTLSLHDALPISFLGVTTGDLTPSLARNLGYEVRRGALVGAVEEGSPAEKAGIRGGQGEKQIDGQTITPGGDIIVADRKSTRLNSSHVSISYAVF